jgi:manganese transport protein
MIIGWGINSAMILLAAATFFKSGIQVTELPQAQETLKPLLGNQAGIIFAVALLFSGIASTITSGMAAGTIVAGLFKEPYDIKDNHTRVGVILSLIVATLIIFFVGNPLNGLIISQMLLSIQLPITIFMQVWLTSSEKVMGKYKNGRLLKIFLYGIGSFVTVLNILLFLSFL